MKALAFMAHWNSLTENFEYNYSNSKDEMIYVRS